MADGLNPLSFVLLKCKSVYQIISLNIVEKDWGRGKKLEKVPSNWPCRDIKLGKLCKVGETWENDKKLDLAPF